MADPDTRLTGAWAALHPHCPALPTGESILPYNVVAAHTLIGASRLHLAFSVLCAIGV
ncbi:hypothetical protein [Chloroflexus sp.]|uniref:hypothetical protein n=1 Tax=Chloroflexus sp. TaxID=1904827 RepID=UPI002ADD5FC7|nr:hypothetical protein [Chloroflexus sp.]